jgi:protein TonB
MITRLSSSLIFAAGITFGLLLLMQTLIATGRSPFSSSDPIPIPIWPGVRDDTETIVEEIIEPPPIVEPPPERIQPLVAAVIDVGGIIGNIIPGTKIVIPTGTPGQPNGGIVPIAIMQPDYPRRARQIGLDGYVIVEFTVTSIGNVVNAYVIESSSKLFEKSSLRAVTRFKYKPQVVDGVAIDTPGIQYLFSFTLEE